MSPITPTHSIKENGINHDTCTTLRNRLQTISQGCTECGICVQECAFLKKYGTPKRIADSFHLTEGTPRMMPFECSLCELCTGVCPLGLNPADMFLQMRQEITFRREGTFTAHGRLGAFERRGTSRRYTYYALPSGCDTVFFPGCALSGSRPDKVWKVYERLIESISSLGIVLDCCTKPSHDLGDMNRFNAMFNEMKDYLVSCGVRRVLVACPSCYRVFKQYGSGVSVKTVYEALQEVGLPETGVVFGRVTVHDACTVRFNEHLPKVIRELVRQKGLTIEEMPHSGTKTLCCGEGGAVGFLSPELADKWGVLRKSEAKGRHVITYCAGCANHLNRITPASHVLDLLFEPDVTLSGKAKVSKPPITYWNRLKLKRDFRRNTEGALTRERTFTAGPAPGKGGALKNS